MCSLPSNSSCNRHHPRCVHCPRIVAAQSEALNEINALNISNDFLSVGVSGMDSSEILVGRPFGGCGILYRKSLSPVIRRIFTSSQRLCAISLTLHNSLANSPFAVLFVCVYFPTDYSNVASHTAFAESIGELDGIMSAENFDNMRVILILICPVLVPISPLSLHS